MIVLTAPTGTGPYTVQLYLEGSATLAATASCAEIGSLGQYAQGTFTVTGGGTLAAGRYWTRFLDSDSDPVEVAGGRIFLWDGTQHVDERVLLSRGNAAWATATGFNTTTPPTPTAIAAAITIPTPPTVAAITTGVTTPINAARDAVIARGNAAWTTGTGGGAGGASLTDIQSAITTAQTAIITRGNEAWVTATGIPALSAIQTAIGAAQTAIIDRGNTAWVTATGFNTAVPPTIGAIESAINTARDAVLDRGNAAWGTATGFNTAVPPNIGAIQAAIGAAQTAIIDRGNAAWVTGTGGTGGSGGASLTDIQSAIGAAQTAILDRGNAAWTTATGFNTIAPPALADINASISASQAAIISRGNVAWITGAGGTGGAGGASLVDITTALNPTLAAILDAAKTAAIPVGGNVNVNPTTALATFSGYGITKTKRLTGATGAADSVNVYNSEVIA